MARFGRKVGEESAVWTTELETKMVVDGERM